MTAPDDDALLAELAELLRADGTPPPGVVEASKELFAWRTIDAELAALTFDSVLDDERELARSAAQPRILTFEAGELTIEAEIDASPNGRRLIGQLTPPQPAEIEADSGAGSSSGRADAMGRFSIDLPSAAGRVSLRVRLEDGTVVAVAPTAL